MQKLRVFIAVVIILSVILTACKGKSDESVKNDESGQSNDSEETAEDQSSDVIVTLTSGTKLNLTGDPAEIIRTVLKDNGLILDHIKARLYAINDSGVIYFPYGNSAEQIATLRQEKDYVIGLNAQKTYINSEQNIYNGYLSYEFNIYRDKPSLKNLSLLKGWNGDISRTDDFMDDTNSFSIMNSIRYLFFKNGRIVYPEDIIAEYKGEATKVIEQYQQDIIEYYMKTRNWSVQETQRYMAGTVASFPIVRIGNENLDKPDSAEYRNHLFRICISLAMNDWAAQEDGTVENYGCIVKTLSSFAINIHCSGEDFSCIFSPAKENENGEIIPS